MPYYRNASGSQDEVVGSGLGLAIVKRLADRLHAQVRIEDVMDPIGTLVTVNFVQASST